MERDRFAKRIMKAKAKLPILSDWRYVAFRKSKIVFVDGVRILVWANEWNTHFDADNICVLRRVAK